MKKILVTGGSGTVGTELKKQLRQWDGYESVFFSHHESDVLNFPRAKDILTDYKPDIIIHLAAKTDVDWCEENPEQCYKINVVGVENIAKIAKELNAVFIYPSSFYVYSGEKDLPYDDRIDKPCLDKILGVYAKSKFLGEEVVRKILQKYFIVRFGALFGGGRKDKKFVKKVLDLTKKKKIIRMVDDRITVPSSVKDTVTNLIRLIQTDKYGTYNMVGHGQASYYEYAKAILNYAGIDNVKIIPIKSNSFKEKALRARNLSIINGRLKDLNLDLMRNWRSSLKDYIEELKKEGII